jgi:pantoate--beta-alanine ligase
VAYFGQKDAQQALVVQKLVRDLNMPVRIAVCPTVREPDGLAMSSRNGYLSVAERAEAPRLFRLLKGVKDEAGAREAMRELTAAGWKPDYVEVRRRSDLALAGAGDHERVVVAAARLGATRLIDNVEF